MKELSLPKTPMLLPWLAHKAGITEKRAEVLWHAAVRHAARTCRPDTPDYWQSAMDQLQELIAAESRREDMASFGWRPWARNLADAWERRIDAFDELAMVPIRTLRTWSRSHGLGA